jgi:chitin disaccharide deacetylase
MKKLIIPMGVITMVIVIVLFTYTSSQNKPAQVLLRVDDIGMNHSVNMALQQLAETGIPFSAGIMFACPWYQEGVEILKKYPNISVGIHLTLNSEWKNYKWGPVLGRSAVPSLVDSNGYFYASKAEFMKNNVSLEDVEKELSAQIERGLKSGLKIDYVDYHMGTAISTPELRAIVEKLAAKHKLGISRFFGEAYKTMFDVPVESKKKIFFSHLDSLKQDKVNLLVLHLAQDHPEMNALFDMNNRDMSTSDGISLVSKHRKAELNVVTSPEFLEMVKSRKIVLVTYRDLVRTKGLKSLKWEGPQYY